MTTGYTFTDDVDTMDRARIIRMLNEQAHWAKTRSRETHDAAMAGSRNYGVIHDVTGEQVAYARVITDAVTFAWLCDVVVDRPHRGHGLGKMLIDGVMAELRGLELKRALLVTDDAHGLYEQFGFTGPREPNKLMEAMYLHRDGRDPDRKDLDGRDLHGRHTAG